MKRLGTLISMILILLSVSGCDWDDPVDVGYSHYAQSTVVLELWDADGNFFNRTPNYDKPYRIFNEDRQQVPNGVWLISLRLVESQLEEVHVTASINGDVRGTDLGNKLHKENILTKENERWFIWKMEVRGHDVTIEVIDSFDYFDHQ